MARLLLAKALTAMTVATASLVASATSAASLDSATSITIGPDSDLKSALTALRAGQTLFLRPGTYVLNGTDVTAAHGTADAPIAVQSTSDSDRAIITGASSLVDPDYWLLNRLRIKGTLVGRDTLSMHGGTGWAVSNSEIWRDSGVKTYANIAVSNDGQTATVAGTPPTNWKIVYSCVHDAYNDPTNTNAAQFHNIYVTAKGSAPGTIARNILFNAPDGFQVKVGDGAATRDVVGASGVKIYNNTMSNGVGQARLSGNLNSGAITDNLMERSLARPGGSDVSVGSRVDFLPALPASQRSVIADNYVFAADANFKAYNSTDGYTATSLQTVYHVSADDPNFNSRTCDGFVPGNSKTTSYGRYGTSH